MGVQIVTEQQLIDTLHLGSVEAAKLLGVNKRTITRRRRELRDRGLWSPDQIGGIVPEGYRVKGKSTLYNKLGQPVMEWVKSDTDWETRDRMMREAIEAMREELPRAGRVPPPAQVDQHLCNLFVLTDFHLGMKAWGEETGDDDWDLDKAEALLVAWVTNAIERSPVAKTAILAQMGDFLHWDGMEAVTPTNRHTLDADTRFQKVVRVSIKLTRYLVQALLNRHEEVVLIQTGGNHDPASTIWLREFFAIHYADEPRVRVDTGAGLYFYHEHGQTSLFFHHGHRKGVSGVQDVIVSKFRDVFGRTKHSYCHIGHFHHYKAEEGVVLIEQHRTLAPKDAYAANAGYVSGRDAKVITYHAEYGEVSRISVTPEMLKGPALNDKPITNA